MADTLDVYLYGQRVATISRRGDNLRLRYLPDYVQGENPVPISVQLPVVAGVAPSETTKRFLENLLPDRADVRTRWAREAKLTSESAFDLLSVYGADVAGALEFYREGTIPRVDAKLSPVTDEAIAARTRQIRADDSNWLEHHPIEEGFSLGGAQGKFALARRDGQWFEPTGRHPSTHIFKPGVHNLDGSDVTEHITLQVARRLGLIVASTEIGCFDGEHVLVVERFDRFFIDDSYVRLHQEDLAQATGTSHLNKYERDAGPNYRTIFAVFDRDLAPALAREAKRRFSECLTFSWIIGHNDGHSKNYSLTHAPDASFLSPFYDLNTVLPFELPDVVRAKDYRAYDGVSLAFSMGGSATIGEVNVGSLRALEQDAELPSGHLEDFALHVATNLQSIVTEVIDALPEDLRSILAVQLYPYATYAQTLRVRDLLGGTTSTT
ncbi:HipA domain-containing protein [Microbacterium amylolyticum]|uniref:Serine/threonine-protein kinase HipA n=1 Tax=Microbacterium amylolyticum TaxID=936337 RepID=A0ABS4ZIY7_9MICO|nr:HipA domain-containing protein [Microbacterium amylolyticum]MBP2436950.1 serine/threonine-protein kinase HipA [Microbacterium amylolyticum]